MIRDSFYDAEYHGCDWEGLWEKFRPVVQSIQTKTDFREILNLMVGELNASHLGHLMAIGTTLTAISVRISIRTNWRIAGISRLPISAGFAVDPAARTSSGRRISGHSRWGRTQFAGYLPKLLQRKSGKRVSLKLNDNSQLDGARDLIVQPIDGTRYANLRYKGWVRCNGKYVHEKSNGRLGYVHIHMMSYDAYIQFTADLDSETHNKAGGHH